MSKLKTLMIFLVITSSCCLSSSCTKNSDENDNEDEISATDDNGWTGARYQRAYNIAESAAKNLYNSLIKAQTSYNGSAMVITNFRRCLRDQQRSMRESRLKALKIGYRIEQSPYETVYA